MEAFKNFDEETAIHNIQNNCDSAVVNAEPTINYKCNFNPFDKMGELYERMLKEKDTMIAELEKMLSNQTAVPCSDTLYRPQKIVISSIKFI